MLCLNPMLSINRPYCQPCAIANQTQNKQLQLIMDPEFKTNPSPAKISVRSSQIFINIADQDMSDFFLDVVGEEAEKQDGNAEGRSLEPEPEPEPEHVELQKETVSRLEIEIEKNGLNFVPVYGQIFIMLIRAELVGETKVDEGTMLVTNYRISFFKKKQKKVDLPFGFIASVRLLDKTGQLLVFLKYHYCWKFKVGDPKKFEQLKIFLQLYLKFDSTRSCFAYNYALKSPQDPKARLHPAVADEYERIGIDMNPHQFTKMHNPDFEVCNTYPAHFFIPASKSLSATNIGKLASKWHGSRLPVAMYIYKPLSKESIVLWRSSYVMADRAEKLSDVAKYLVKAKGASQKLHVFDTGSKVGKKCVEEYEINSVCQMHYLELEGMQAVRASYEMTIECFIGVKKGFIKDIINSRWYEMVLQVLKATLSIKNSLLMGQSTLLKCPDGRERSAQLSALVQLVLNPFYRTFVGFPRLIEKQFQGMGYPFATRLGLRSEKEEQVPLFIQFLDCTSQLMHSNPMSFEFNFKYLSKMSNLMYSCLFGTFITDSPKEWAYNNVEQETVPIWKELVSDLTTNAFFQQKHGDLEVPKDMNAVRLWKEHFWYLTSPPKETYRLHPLAEDNLDYVNLECLKVIRENYQLQDEINRQRKEMQQLRNALEQCQ